LEEVRGELKGERGELERALQEGTELRAQLNEALAGRDGAEDLLRDTNRDLSDLRMDLEVERSRAAEGSAQYAALRATAGVRLLDGYWRVMRRLAPEGSPARRLLLQARSAVGGVIRWRAGRSRARSGSDNPPPASDGPPADETMRLAMRYG
jgi:septal ring factor EnvC (AmiA/AmiB activator)